MQKINIYIYYWILETRKTKNHGQLQCGPPDLGKYFGNLKDHNGQTPVDEWSRSPRCLP